MESADNSQKISPESPAYLDKFAQGSLRTIMMSSPLAIYLTDFEGKIRFCNLKACEMSGYTSEELLNMTIMLLDKEFTRLEICLQMWNQMILDEPINFESKHITKAGKILNVEIHSVRIALEGEPFILGMVQDVTDKKVQEIAFKRKERLLQTAQAMAKMGNWDYDLMTNKFYWSNEVYVIFELEPTQFELTYESYIAMVHPDDRQRIHKQFLAAYTAVKPYQFTAKIITGKGNLKYIEGNGDFEVDENGKVFIANGSAQDVTEKVAILNKLKEKDRFFEYSVDLFTIADFEGKFITVNPSWTRELGWTEQEFTSQPWLNFVHPDDVQSTLAVFDGIKQGKEFLQFENRYLSKAGTYVWIAWNAYPYLKENLVYSVGRNITAQRELENLYHHLFNQMLDGFALHEMIYNSKGEAVDYRFISVNPAFEKLTGLKGSDIVGKTVLEVIPTTESLWIDTYAEVISKGKEVHFEGYSAGLSKHYEIKAFKIDERTFATVVMDVTERILAESKLKENNEMLHKLAAQVPGVVYKYQLFEDGRSCFPFSSPGMMDIYGFKPEEVETDATPVFGRLHSDDLERVSDAIFESAREQTLFDCEFRVNMPNMGVQWRQCNARPEKLDDGSTLWYGIITDITDRKLKEEIIARSEEKYRIVADNTFNWEFWEDEYGNMLYVSPACKKVTGYLAEEFISQSDLVQNIILPDDLYIFINHQEDVKNRRIHSKCTFRIITKSGEIKHIQHFCQPALDTNGNFRGVRGTNLDISESVSQLNKIQSLLSLEEEQTKRMRSFTHIVSHNLRSHTANMQGLLTLLKEDYPAYFDNNYIQLLNQSAENLNQTLVHLNQVLNINMIEKKQWVKVNLKEYIQKAIDSISMVAKSSHVDIQVLVPAHLHLQTVPAYLESILLNLLTNGIKYASADRDSYLKFEAMVIQNQLHLSYSDNGIGIDLNRHGAAIFGMYKTFHGNKDSKGLGLFMTRNQVEAMGGKIEVESMVNIGTTFTITLPLVQPEMA